MSRPFHVDRPHEAGRQVDEAILRYRLENPSVNIFNCIITMTFEAEQTEKANSMALAAAEPYDEDADDVAIFDERMAELDAGSGLENRRSDLAK